jgi:flavorubredoxin
VAAIEIGKGIITVGALDWDRRLFDELIPLPDGTTYNSYVVRGADKTALMDAVDPPKVDDLLGNLRAAGVGRIDYLVSHHAEQDHSGGIAAVLGAFPQAVLVTNEKCKGMLLDLHRLPEGRVRVVADGETLDLGARTLEFMLAPWVHWPETMVTYLREDRVLFSCDFFGSHLAQSQPLVSDQARTILAAKRYFAEIMMPFRTIIRRHVEKLKALPISMIAPSHGPVWPRPALIMDAYADWCSDRTANLALVPFVSMHGSTRLMVDHLVDGLTRQGVEVVPFNLVRTDIGELARELVDASTLVLGTPTVLAGPHPAVASAAFLTNALRPKTKFASVIGSYGWGGKTVEGLQATLCALKAEFLPPVMAKGLPLPSDFEALDALAAAIAERHRAIGVLA